MGSDSAYGEPFYCDPADEIVRLRADLSAAERERDEARQSLNSIPNGHNGCAKDHSSRLGEFMDCWICKTEAAERRAEEAEARFSVVSPADVPIDYDAWCALLDQMQQHRDARDAAVSRAERAEALIREKLAEGRCGVEWGERARAALAGKEAPRG